MCATKCEICEAIEKRRRDEQNQLVRFNRISRLMDAITAGRCKGKLYRLLTAEPEDAERFDGMS